MTSLRPAARIGSGVTVVVIAACGGRATRAAAADDGLADGMAGDSPQDAPAEPDREPSPPPQSCRLGKPGAGKNCGLNKDGDCCAALPLPGGTFLRYYDGDEWDIKDKPATVSAFALDKYEITLGRFRIFVDAYPESKPSPGAGAHPRIPQSGWRSTWSLPATQVELRAALSSGAAACEGATWTDQPGPNEDKPINCVTWYELFAFCAWDNGRLPTEAERMYAALGGSEQRIYPWSVPSSNKIVDATYAVYGATPNISQGPAPVGTRPKGAGRWGHLDLGGNIEEFALDWYGKPTMPCTDCANLGPVPDGDVRVILGGNYFGDESLLRASRRTPSGAPYRDALFGSRCARDP